MDTGFLHFDEVSVTTPKKRMKKIKLEMYNMDPEELDDFIDRVHDLAAANSKFASLAAQLAALNTRRGVFSGKLLAVADAETELASATSALNEDRPGMETEMEQFANAAEAVTGITEADLLAIDFKLRSAAAPIGPMPAPQNVKAKMSTLPGGIKVSCVAVAGASIYLKRYREHIDGTPWIAGEPSTSSRSEIPNLISGKTYAVQMAAVGAAGQGPWSDEAVCMAP